MSIKKRVASRYLEKQGFNKYNVPELVGQLMSVLEKNGLEETVAELKQRGFTKIINRAWQSRGKTATKMLTFEDIAQRGVRYNSMEKKYIQARIDDTNKINWRVQAYTMSGIKQDFVDFAEGNIAGGMERVYERYRREGVRFDVMAQAMQNIIDVMDSRYIS